MYEQWAETFGARRSDFEQDVQGLGHLVMPSKISILYSYVAALNISFMKPDLNEQKLSSTISNSLVKERTYHLRAWW